MRKTKFVTAGLVLFIGALLAIAPSRDGVSAAGSASESEKEKAMKSPYPNDFGPESIEDQIKDYPADKKEGYKLLLAKCAQCHSAARPLHSRFVELEGKEDKDQEAAIKKLKASNPEMFKDYSIWQIETKIWSRYVKRMMAKPGCKIEKAEGKKIYEFLVYDSGKRKLGANAKKWEEHRKKLLGQLKEKNPARFKELEEHKDL